MIECLNSCGPMKEILYKGVEIDLCEKCQGVWLDFGELTQIIETKSETWPQSIIDKVLKSTGTPGVPIEEEYRNLRCPKCNERLPPNNYQNNSGIVVNPCNNKHGIWLDKGELTKLQIYMEKWDEIATTNRKKYKGILREIEEEHNKAYSEMSKNGPSSFDIVNVFLNKITRFIN